MKYFYTRMALALMLFGSIEINSQCFDVQTYTNSAASTFTIPGNSSDMYTIEIECVGADGATSLLGGNPINQGGSGATMTARFDVVGGDVLTVFVGAAGLTGGSPSGGGGGGGSAVIINGSDVLIAAGAGGGGGLGGATGIGFGGEANTDSPPQGGTGVGAPGGGGFNDDGADGQAGTGGSAGTLTGMGAGGVGGVVAGWGGQGFGGGGGGAGTVGGGGGGYEGGAGGLMAPQGGMGGDSYVNLGFSSMVMSTTAGVNGGGNGSDGAVTITCISDGGGSNLSIVVDLSADPTCEGEMNGSITASATSGTPPYQFSINGVDFMPSGTFNNLSAGVYTVTVMDAMGDTDVAEVTLTDPDAVVAILDNAEDNVCFGDQLGTINVSGSGGSGNYTYSIDGGAAQASGLFENLASATYSVTVMDDSGCSDDLMVSIGNPEIISFTVEVSNLLCTDDGSGTIEIDAIGGVGPYEYSLGGTDYQNLNSFTGLDAQAYQVFVLDDNGCIVEMEVSVEEPDALSVMSTVTDAGCGGMDGSIVATAEGGTSPYLYSLNGMSSTSGVYSDLPAGDYTLSVDDENGCTVSEMITVNSVGGGSISISIDATTNVSCFGDTDGTFTVSASGGSAPYTYQIDTITSMTGIFSGLAAGDYMITAIDSDGCSMGIQATLSQPAAITLELDSLVDVSCFGEFTGLIQISGSGGTAPYVYSLNDTLMSADGNFAGLGSSMYTAAITDANGCNTTLDLSIIEPGPVLLSIDTIIGTSCGEAMVGVIELSGGGGTAPYSFSLNDTISSTDGMFTGLSGQQYTALITDANGCIVSQSVTVPVEADFSLSVIDVIDVKCFGESNGEVIISAIGPGSNYSLAFNFLGQYIDTFFIESGDTVSLGGYSATTTQISLIDDDDGCTQITNVTINQPDSLILIAGVITQTDTFNSVTLTGQGGVIPYTYSIDGVTFQASSDFSGLPAGSYIFTLRDANGCIATTEVEFVITSTNDLLERSIQVFPNPTSQSLYLTLTEGEIANISQIEVYDDLGRRIVALPNQMLTQMSGEKMILDCSGLTSGIYYLRIQTSAGVVAKQFVVQK